MSSEIERKFLVQGDEWKSRAHTSTAYSQGYLCLDPERTVRVRRAGEKGFITIKGITQGIKRAEYEYEIPLEEAKELLTLCLHLIEKTRHLVKEGNHTWEIDVFKGENLGLIVAEIELASETEELSLPPWVGKEVSDDPRYYNANLAQKPYTQWKTQ